MNKRYEIVIKEHCVETVTAGREWKEGAGTEEDNGYGYTPEIEKKQSVTREIYKQNTDELVLTDVIIAINGLNRIDKFDDKEKS